MTSAFNKAVHHTLEVEGLFSNHSWDPGGKTKYGITESLARAYGKDVEALTVDQAKEIYFTEFWQALTLESVAQQSWRVAVEIFDTAVNCGKDRAIRILQESLSTIFDEDVSVDGKLGPKTRVALLKVSARYESHLVAALNGFQFEYYLGLLRKGHSAAKRSIRGWMLRLETPTS